MSKSTIWKFDVQPGVNEYEIPGDHMPLDVQAQGDAVSLWCLVEPDQPKHKVRFHVYPTGVEFDSSSLYYIGTFQIIVPEPPPAIVNPTQKYVPNYAILVFHVFEDISTAESGIPDATKEVLGEPYV